MLVSREDAIRRLTSTRNLATRFGTHTQGHVQEPRHVSASTREADSILPSANSVSSVPINSHGGSERSMNSDELTSNSSSAPNVTHAPTRKQHIHLTPDQQVEIGVQARMGTVPQTELAAQFGVSQRSVSGIKLGQQGDQEAQEKIESKVAEVHDAALDRLMSTLGLITNDKMSGCDAKELSGIAANMAKVVHNTAPRQEQAGDNRTQILIYAPQQRSEKTFKRMEV